MDAATTTALLGPETIGALIAMLATRGYTVVAPAVHDGVVVLAEVHGIDDLPVGRHDDQDAGRYRLERTGTAELFGYAVGPDSFRRFLFPPRHLLWSATTSEGRLRVDEALDVPPPVAFVGVRACDVAALAMQDRVLRDGPVPDPRYTAARDRALVVAVNCARPAATCFCASTGTGPRVGEGADVVLTEVLEGGHRLLAEARTARGEEVLDSLATRAASAADVEAADAVVERTRAAMTRSLDPGAARDVLRASLDHPHWDDVAARCLSCTNCTLVCPTCFCTAVEDVNALDGATAERVQRWDSCFSLDHSYLHGSGPVRFDIRARYRQWLTHKLSTWWDQFGASGCVGCGRCITWCPAGIDLTREVDALAAPPEEPA